LAARIDKKTLSAPFAAATNLHTLEVGQYLAANSLITGLTGGAEQRWIDFDLPQDKANLKIGEPVSLSGAAVANKGAINAPVIATVVAIEPAINQASRTRGYRALLTDSDDNLSPGAVVDVAVQTGIVEGVIRLPATAVRRSSFGAYVYRLATSESGASAPYRAERLPVTVVRAEGDEVIITAGLAPGDLIAALGAFKLNAGMLVHVVERETLRDAVEAAAP
uniref:efflux RND transporter periplasmic adaptor subunit n=1 Tax=Reinekea sp. TaxID=1970455 RepID=UPI00257B77A6